MNDLFRTGGSVACAHGAACATCLAPSLRDHMGGLWRGTGGSSGRCWRFAR